MMENAASFLCFSGISVYLELSSTILKMNRYPFRPIGLKGPIRSACICPTKPSKGVRKRSEWRAYYF